MTHLSRKIKIILINSEEYEIEIPNNITNYWEIRKYLRNELKRFGFKPDFISLYENEKNNWTLIIHTIDVTHQIHYCNYFFENNKLYRLKKIFFNERMYECEEDKYLDLEKLKSNIKILYTPILSSDIEKDLQYQEACNEWCHLVDW